MPMGVVLVVLVPPEPVIRYRLEPVPTKIMRYCQELARRTKRTGSEDFPAGSTLGSLDATRLS